MRKTKVESALIAVGSERTMDSREIAAVTGKRHDNVIRDIEEMLNKLQGGLLRSEDTPGNLSGDIAVFRDTYINEQNGQEYRCYKLPYRETMIIVSGYSVELRAAVVDRWIELEKAEQKRLSADKKDRRKAADTRNYFTDMLKDHGCTKPGHYIQITQAMKRSLGIPVERKKDKYERREILRTMAAEALAALNIDVNNAQGYIECRRESEKAGSTVAISAGAAMGEING